MAAEIVKGEPIPEVRMPALNEFPFHKMEVGDCMIVDAGPSGNTHNCRGYYTMQAYLDRLDRLGLPRAAFVGRKLPDRPGKVGIWRTS